MHQPANGLNGLNGLNGPNGVNDPDGLNELNGPNGLTAFNGLNGPAQSNTKRFTNSPRGVNGLMMSVSDQVSWTCMQYPTSISLLYIYLQFEEEIIACAYQKIAARADLDFSFVTGSDSPSLPLLEWCRSEPQPSWREKRMHVTCNRATREACSHVYVSMCHFLCACKYVAGWGGSLDDRKILS
jgi:hypothetical protein